MELEQKLTRILNSKETKLKAIARNYQTTCSECRAKVQIIERPMGVPGGKEKEQAYCPKCGNRVAEHMTDGFLGAHLIEGGIEE